MAFNWPNTFVAATASGGLDSGSHTDTDEWPFTLTDHCFVQDAGGASSFPTFTFDMSVGPGDKKGFWIWVQWYVDNANGYQVDAIRLVDAGGPTTLWTDSSPGITVTQTSGGEKIWPIRIPDSAFSGNPDIDQLRVEFDVTNLHTGNNRLRIAGIRLSKSPFTAAQEVDPPSDLAGKDYAAYLASGLATLGAADSEDIVVIPDQSGVGRHLVRWVGSTCTYKTADGGYIDFPSTANRFIAAWGNRVTGNHIYHMRIYPVDTGTTNTMMSTTGQFANVVGTPTDPNDKNVMAIDDAGLGGGDQWLLMSGIGDGAAHKYGGSVTFDAWVRVTQWVQDSGNEHVWENDDATPDIDAASGSNNLFVYSFGDRETDDRPFRGRLSEFWVVEDDAVTISEAELDSARDEWVNGSGVTISLYATGDATISSVFDEADTTVDLYLSVDDDPSTPNDADWINNTADVASTFLELTDMVSTFDQAVSATIVVRYRGQAWFGGSLNLYARLYAADESTPLSDEVIVATVSATGAFANTSTINFTGIVAGNKTTWDGAKIRFRWGT